MCPRIKIFYSFCVLSFYLLECRHYEVLKWCNPLHLDNKIIFKDLRIKHQVYKKKRNILIFFYVYSYIVYNSLSHQNYFKTILLPSSNTFMVFNGLFILAENTLGTIFILAQVSISKSFL